MVIRNLLTLLFNLEKNTNLILACEGGVYMFEKIYDDVYLVKNHNTSTFSIPDSFANDSWLYRKCIGFIFHLTEQINRFSYKYRKIMRTLNTEKQSLLVG